MTQAGTAVLEFRNVTRRFPRPAGAESGAIVAVREVSLELSPREVVAIIGPSGCGKSTLLNLASGLDRPNEGEVFVNGTPVARPRRGVAFMLQKDLLLPWRTIRENIELGQEIQGMERHERSERAHRLLATFQLEGFANHYPHQLSGGMRQRAALARTMALNPELLLLDEPFSAVDAQTRMLLQRELASVIAAGEKTALLITHDIGEAVVLSDRVLVMSKRPGTIVAEIVIELPDRSDPFQRRRRAAVADYIEQLSSLLHLGGDEVGSEHTVRKEAQQ